MKSVHEVSQLTGISKRTLQYYDEIGLLPPSQRTEAGYRLYDDDALERLQQILLFRSLEFPLKDIQAILDSPGFDREQALADQIALLELRRQHIDNLIALAKGCKARGGTYMHDTRISAQKLNQYQEEAKARWGKTKEYQEFEEKNKGRADAEQERLSQDMMAIFASLGALKKGDPAAPEAQKLVKKLQDFITRNFYTCTDQILLGLGQMYASGGDMGKNIDQAGGNGTADFACRAIQAYCGKA